MRRLPWYRDRATLAKQVEHHGSISAAAEANGTPRPTVQHWARILGVESRHAKNPIRIDPTPRANASTSGHTYVVGAAGQRLVKIGRTAGEPRQRIGQLQTGSAVELVLICTLTTQAWEEVLHHHYREQRKHGEWFALTTGDVLRILEWACSDAFGAHAPPRGELPSAEQCHAAGWDDTTRALALVFG